MYKTIGFVIKKDDLSEADQILTIYTKDFGKLKVLSRGARKTEAKLTSHLQLFDLSEIMFVQGKIYKTITAALVLKSFSELKKDLNKNQTIFRICVLINKHLLFEEKEETLWNLISVIFQEIQSAKENQLEILERYFEYNLLNILGFRPEYESSKTSEEIESILNAFSEKKIILKNYSEKTLATLKLILEQCFQNMDITFQEWI